MESISLNDIYDVAIIRHGFSKYVRDYEIEFETNVIDLLPGQYLLTLTHCFDLEYKTRLDAKILTESWDDVFIDYNNWVDEGEPEGYLWANNWSLAYPGFKIIENSQKAEKWS